MILTCESNEPPTRRVRFAFGVLVWLAGMAPVSAQQDVAGSAAGTGEAVRYTVELIVFTYEDTSSAGNEVFTPPERLSDASFDGLPSTTAPADGPGDGPEDGPEDGPVFDDRMTEAGAADEDEQAGTLLEIPARARIEFERLDPEAFQMQDTYQKLERLDAYRPILHAAWTQTTHEKPVSPALPLRALGDPPLGLDGTITLYQSRFLHLDVDLTLDANGAAASGARQTATDRLVNPGSAADATPTRDELGAFQRPPTRYRITEDRIMRDGDLRYFDHPRFGVLARVSRVQSLQGSSAGD